MADVDNRFRRKVLLSLSEAEALRYYDTKMFDIVERNHVDSTRWHQWYEVIFRSGDGYYRWVYGAGSTESQEDRELDLEAYEVFPKEVTVTTYE